MTWPTYVCLSLYWRNSRRPHEELRVLVSIGVNYDKDMTSPWVLLTVWKEIKKTIWKTFVSLKTWDMKATTWRTRTRRCRCGRKFRRHYELKCVLVSMEGNLVDMKKPVCPCLFGRKSRRQHDELTWFLVSNGGNPNFGPSGWHDKLICVLITTENVHETRKKKDIRARTLKSPAKCLNFNTTVY